MIASRARSSECLATYLLVRGYSLRQSWELACFWHTSRQVGLAVDHTLAAGHATREEAHNLKAEEAQATREADHSLEGGASAKDLGVGRSLVEQEARVLDLLCFLKSASRSQSTLAGSHLACCSSCEFCRQREESWVCGGGLAGVYSS